MVRAPGARCTGSAKTGPTTPISNPHALALAHTTIKKFVAEFILIIIMRARICSVDAVTIERRRREMIGFGHKPRTIQARLPVPVHVLAWNPPAMEEPERSCQSIHA